MNRLTIAIIGLLCAVAALAVLHFRTSNNAPHAPAPAASGRLVSQGEAITMVSGPVAAHASAVPAVRTVASASDWKAQFTSSADYLQFVKAALPAAKAGDGRAAYYIGQAMFKCGPIIAAARRGGDPEAYVQQQLASLHPGIEQAIKDEHEAKARRCFGLAKENAVDGLPETLAYWQAQAAKAGDPLAQADVAAQAAAEISVDPRMPEDVRAAKLKIVQDNLRAVVESGDPTALFRAGMLMANPQLTTDALRGVSVALAACDLGLDCTAANPDMLFHDCAVSGRCPPGMEWPQELQSSMGQEGYAQLYARAQQVVTAARAHDWNAVLADLTIDKHP